MSEFPGNSVKGITCERGDSIDTKSKPWFGIPQRETTPDEKGWYSRHVEQFYKNVDVFNLLEFKTEML